MTEQLMNGDDAFLLGSVCSAAIAAGHGRDVRSIYSCLQKERPENAGGFILEGMMLQQEGRLDEALSFIFEHRVLEKPLNSEEAVSFYALLLVQAGDVQGGYKIAKAAINMDEIVSQSARSVFEQIVNEIEAESALQ